MLKRTGAPFLLEKVQAEEAGIVSRVCVVVARVAESDDEFHSGKSEEVNAFSWVVGGAVQKMTGRFLGRYPRARY